MSCSEQGCYRASADPTIGHCLQWKHPKEQQLAGESHSPYHCSPGCSAPQSGVALRDRAAQKASGPNQPHRNQHSVRAGESPGLEATHPMLQEQSFVVARRISGESLTGASTDALKCSWECHVTLCSSGSKIRI